MLQQLRHDAAKGASIAIKDASFPVFFYDGLQYSPPARGTWNIVHTNMLVPDSHQIYICAFGCLRGVVLTAAEMGTMNRFSSIVIEEHHLYDGTMEDTIVDSVGAILEGLLPYVPKACFMYPSCIHHFMGCDLDEVYRRLTDTYKQTQFVPCWMDPIRRESALTAEIRTRKQIYSLLKKSSLHDSYVNIIGSNLPVDEDCELVGLLTQHGYGIRQIPTCQTYEDYEKLAQSILNIGQEPLAKPCLIDMKERLAQPYVYLSASWYYDEIQHNLQAVAAALDLACPTYDKIIDDCEQALARAQQRIGAMPIAIDYTAVMRPFSLGRLLLSHGFNVQRIYIDGASNEDKDDFAWIQQHYPELTIYATKHSSMRYISRKTELPMLAIGQKAAYFTGTTYFVDIVEGGGLRDFTAILKLTELMIEAVNEEKEAKPMISRKGWGCTSCL